VVKIGLLGYRAPSVPATAALLPVEKRAAFVQRVAAALAAGETSVLGAIAVAQRGCLSAPPVAS
jgi:hypothetical protein